MAKEFKLEDCLNSWMHDLDSYSAGKSFQDVITEHGFQENEIIKIASNESTIGCSPKAIEAAKAASSRSHYYDDAQSAWFAGYLSSKFREQGLNMDKLGVVVGNGMDYIIDILGKLFLDPDSSVVISSPTFVYYKLLANWAGSEVIDVPRGANYYTDPEKIVNAVKENTKIVFICSPNNPTGTLVPLEDIEYIVKNVNCLVFVDHAYIEFTDCKDEARKIIEKYPNLIIGYTFSKAYALAGFRVGYGLMHKNIQEKYLQVIAPFANARTSLAAAKAAYEDRDHLRKIMDNNKDGKKYLYAKLPDLGFSFSKSETNFILMSHPKFSSEKISEELLKKGIIIRPMKSVCPNSIRVTIGTAEENQRFIEALQGIVF